MLKITLGGMIVGILMTVSSGVYATGSDKNCRGECVKPKDNSTINNPVTNTNTSTNTSTNTNTSKSSSTGIAVSSSSASSQVGNVTGGSVGSVAGGANTSSQTVSIKNPSVVSSAYAPALTSGNDTCMGSSSLGASVAGLGFSVGSTWTDGNCVRLKNARELYAMGQQPVAIAMMCQNDDVRKAAESAGSKICISTVQTKPAVSTEADICSTSTDSIIRFRHNCS